MLISIGFLLVSILSCKNSNRSGFDHIDVKEEVQHAKEFVKSYSRSTDILEDMYQNVIKKNKDLDDIENSMHEVNELVHASKREFNNYNNISHEYYNAALTKVQSLSDSVLKLKLQMALKLSESRYQAYISNLTTPLKQIDTNENIIRDYHLAMKVIMTMPELERIQKETKVKDSLMKATMNNQQKLLQSIKEQAKL